MAWPSNRGCMRCCRVCGAAPYFIRYTLHFIHTRCRRVCVAASAPSTAAAEGPAQSWPRLLCPWPRHCLLLPRCLVTGTYYYYHVLLLLILGHRCVLANEYTPLLICSVALHLPPSFLTCFVALPSLWPGTTSRVSSRLRRSRSATKNKV